MAFVLGQEWEHFCFSVGCLVHVDRVDMLRIGHWLVWDLCVQHLGERGSLAELDLDPALRLVNLGAVDDNRFETMEVSQRLLLEYIDDVGILLEGGGHPHNILINSGRL